MESERKEKKKEGREKRGKKRKEERDEKKKEDEKKVELIFSFFFSLSLFQPESLRRVAVGILNCCPGCPFEWTGL